MHSDLMKFQGVSEQPLCVILFIDAVKKLMGDFPH